MGGRVEEEMKKEKHVEGERWQGCSERRKRVEKGERTEKGERAGNGGRREKDGLRKEERLEARRGRMRNSGKGGGRKVEVRKGLSATPPALPHSAPPRPTPPDPSPPHPTQPRIASPIPTPHSLAPPRPAPPSPRPAPPSTAPPSTAPPRPAPPHPTAPHLTHPRPTHPTSRVPTSRHPTSPHTASSHTTLLHTTYPIPTQPPLTPTTPGGRRGQQQRNQMGPQSGLHTPRGEQGGQVMHDIDQLNMTVMEVLERRRRLSPCDGSEEFSQIRSRRASGTRVSYLTVPSQSSSCHKCMASLPDIRSRRAAVTRTTAGNQQSDCVSRQDLGSPPLAAIGGASEKPTPTFGVGKAVPRGYPSVARRTRIHLPLAELRRFSVPKTASPVPEPTSGFGREMRTIPTVYLPTGSEDEDCGSDLLTIPSSYMLLSVSGTTGAPSTTGDNRGDTGTGYRRLSEDENETARHLRRRGSSVSVVYSQPPRMPTITSPVESSETRSEHLVAEADTTTVDEFPNAQTMQSPKVGDSRCTRLAANTGRPVKVPPVVNLLPIATSPEESRPALSRDGEMNRQRRFNFERPLGDGFVPPADAWSAQQGFIDPIRNIRLQMARRKPKNFDEHEEVVDAMSIIRDSLNRMMLKEAGLRTQSPPEMLDDAHVYPLTFASLQQKHLFAKKPALGEMLDVMKGIRYPDPHFDQVDSDAHKFGTRYISLEKFSVVCDWVRSVEQLRQQGLLEGDLVPEADLVWSFDDDYVKGLSTIDSCS